MSPLRALVPMTSLRAFRGAAAAAAAPPPPPRRRGARPAPPRARAAERPTLDDVQRLSEGRAARSARGWGSRAVPHRLNAEERPELERARARGWLALKGSGYRAERKGAPLANIYRQLCDATARPCIVLERAAAGGDDAVFVDLSPLRLPSAAALAAHQAAAARLGAELGLAPRAAGAHAAPFTVILPGPADEAEEESGSEAEADEGGAPRLPRGLPIWRQTPRLVSFGAPRAAAKALAALLAERLAAEAAAEGFS